VVNHIEKNRLDEASMPVVCPPRTRKTQW